MHLNLSSCGWKAVGLNRLMSEGEKDMPPGAKLVSDAGAESPAHGPFISLIRREIASPPVATKMLRAPASRGLLHKWGLKTKQVRNCWFQPWGVWAASEGQEQLPEMVKGNGAEGEVAAVSLLEAAKHFSLFTDRRFKFIPAIGIWWKCATVLEDLAELVRWTREKLSRYSSSFGFSWKRSLRQRLERLVYLQVIQGKETGKEEKSVGSCLPQWATELSPMRPLQNCPLAGKLVCLFTDF